MNFVSFCDYNFTAVNIMKSQIIGHFPIGSLSWPPLVDQQKNESFTLLELVHSLELLYNDQGHYELSLLMPLIVIDYIFTNLT